MTDTTKPDPHAERQTDLNIAFARKDWNMDTKPVSLQVEEPEIIKTMRKNLDGWDNRAVCAYIDALHAANRELAEEVGRLKGVEKDLEHMIAAKSNLLLNIADTLRSRGIDASRHMDERVIELAQRMDKAETRALAAQKDAGRYRILREQNEREHTTRDAECVINWNHGHDWAPVKDLDAAVDAIDAAAK